MNKLLLIGILSICFFTKIKSDKDTFIKQDTTPKALAKKKADKFHKLLQSHYTKGDYEIYKAYCDSLLYTSEKHGFTKMTVLALTSQGIYYSNRGQTSTSIELYHQALEKCKLIPEDYRSKIIVLVNMGNIYNHIGSFEKAIEQMEQVLYLLDTKENSDNVRAACLIALANSYSELKDYENSIKYSEKSRKIGEAINNNNVVATSINNISDAYISLKQYTKAEEYIKEGLDSPKLLDNPKSKSWLLLNAGIVKYHLKELDTSLFYLKKCEVLTGEKKLLQIKMYAHEYLAKVLEEKKEYEASVKEQKKHLALRKTIYNDEKKASNVELSKEIVSSNEELEDATKKNNIMAFLLAGLLFFLGTITYVYIKRKKTLDLEQKTLRKQYKALQQEFLNYKVDSNTSSQNTIETNVESQLKPYKNSSLTKEKREELKNKILTFMKEEKPFLNPELTQSSFSLKLDISSHHFSEVLYYKMEQNFYNFINSYRVLEAQKLIQNPDYDTSKIIAIAFDSGFKSKTSFNRAFKNHTGMTPSEYRKSIKRVPLT